MRSPPPADVKARHPRRRKRGVHCLLIDIESGLAQRLVRTNAHLRRSTREVPRPRDSPPIAVPLYIYVTSIGRVAVRIVGNLDVAVEVEPLLVERRRVTSIVFQRPGERRSTRAVQRSLQIRLAPAL